MLYDKNGKVVCDYVGYNPDKTDAASKTAFVAYMNIKAAKLGMAGTTYASPSGLSGNTSTPQDALKLGIAVCGNAEALKIWHTTDQSFTVYGSNERTISVANNVISGTAADLTPTYPLLGGKGGSLGTNVRAQILLVEVEDKPTMLSLMGCGGTAFTNIFKSAKELADMVKAKLDGSTPTEGTNLAQLVTDGGGYAACVVPNIPGCYDHDYTAAAFIARADVISNTPAVSRQPASTSKVMTMLCALDFITNDRERITVKTADIESGSGSTFYNGDQLTMHDALRIMMMESSNTLANTIARSVGNKILTYGA